MRETFTRSRHLPARLHACTPPTQSSATRLEILSNTITVVAYRLGRTTFTPTPNTRQTQQITTKWYVLGLQASNTLLPYAQANTSPQGKRKSSSKPQGPKKKEKLPTTFQCLFCNHEKSVSVSIEKKSGVGNLQCKVCGQTFQTNINYLSAPVDVYADWIDACDAVAKEAAKGNAETTRSAHRMGRMPTAANTDEDDGDGGFIEHDDLDAEGEYAD
jgi:transcription elongation factor Elf1